MCLMMNKKKSWNGGSGTEKKSTNDKGFFYIGPSVLLCNIVGVKLDAEFWHLTGNWFALWLHSVSEVQVLFHTVFFFFANDSFQALKNFRNFDKFCIPIFSFFFFDITVWNRFSHNYHVLDQTVLELYRLLFLLLPLCIDKAWGFLFYF